MTIEQTVAEPRHAVDAKLKSQPPEPASGAVDERLGRRRKRSGGPKSEEGKAIASRNSIKHGAFADCLPESDEYFREAASVERELKPVGVVEERIATNIAHNNYKTEMLRGFERDKLNASQLSPLNPSEIASRTQFPFSSDYQHLLLEPINTVIIQRELAQAWRRFAEPPKSPSKSRAVACMPDSRVAKLYEKALGMLDRAALVPHLEPEFFDALDIVMGEAQSRLNYLGKRLQQEGEELTLVKYWLYRNVDTVNACIRDFRVDLAISVMNDPNLIRARNHLDSGLKRDIDSLRALREAKVNGHRTRK